MDKHILDTVKMLRAKTGVSMGVCSEASKEANGNYEKALVILRQKCCEIGKKFYKNPERPLVHFLNFYLESENVFVNIKFGSESEFVASSEDLHKFVEELLAEKDIEKFVAEEKNSVEEKLLYLCGLLKENIQILALEKVTKVTSDSFVIHKKGATPHEKVVTGLNLIVLSDKIDDETRKELLINIGAHTSKKINNTISEKFPIIAYTYKMTENDIENFVGSPSVINKDIHIHNLLGTISIKKISSF
jgi:translation elongation factor EF-Ts